MLKDFSEAVNCAPKWWWLCAAQKFINNEKYISAVPKALIMAHSWFDVFCQQTEIYEAEYQTEHNDHKHTLQENRRLRKKREEMRQQVALLQEQVVLPFSKHTHTLYTHSEIHTPIHILLEYLLSNVNPKI